jgi:hypothetical protein
VFFDSLLLVDILFGEPKGQRSVLYLNTKILLNTCGHAHEKINRDSGVSRSDLCDEHVIGSHGQPRDSDPESRARLHQNTKDTAQPRTNLPVGPSK